MAIAASISAAGPSVVAVGSGGLAGALAEVWSDRSVRLQPDHALQPRAISSQSGKNSRILLQVSSLNPVSHAQVARLKGAFPDVVVLLAPAERGDSAAVVECLAREFAEQVEREPWDILGLIGGDGARETLAQLGASGIRIVDSLLEGIPLGVVVGGQADGTPVFTKAGGFGAEDALWSDACERHEGVTSKPVLALTLGDVAGIGPEITAKTLLGHADLRSDCVPVVIGDADAMRRGVRDDRRRSVRRPRHRRSARGRQRCRRASS